MVEEVKKSLNRLPVYFKDKRAANTVYAIFDFSRGAYRKFSLIEEHRFTYKISEKGISIKENGNERLIPLANISILYNGEEPVDN